jgi:hypothetical protein
MGTLAFLTFAVLVMIPLRRFRAGAAGEIVRDDFKFGESANVPGNVSIPNRNSMNLLELPVLFYIGSLRFLVAGKVDAVVLGVAWLYVGLRIVRSLIHLTYNNVMHRLIPFATSNGCWWLTGCCSSSAERLGQPPWRDVRPGEPQNQRQRCLVQGAQPQIGPSVMTIGFGGLHGVRMGGGEVELVFAVQLHHGDVTPVEAGEQRGVSRHAQHAENLLLHAEGRPPAMDVLVGPRQGQRDPPEVRGRLHGWAA